MKSNIIDWLFERAPRGWVPQTALGNEQKQALIWLPGNKDHSDWNYIQHCVNSAVYLGCTQLAFESAIEAQTNKPCWVSWLGLDLDEEPINTPALIELCRELGGSVRCSSGGHGRHLVFRLEKPIWTNHEGANLVVKALTAPIVERVNALGMIVCKADKRVFWLSGGRCAFIFQNEEYHVPMEALPKNRAELRRSTENGPTVDVAGLSPTIRRWVELLMSRGIITRVQARIPIYVGFVRSALESAGEVVQTRSTCRGNGEINGYLNVRPDHISLFSFADGHVIWRDSE